MVLKLGRWVGAVCHRNLMKLYMAPWDWMDSLEKYAENIWT